jgi:tetratricopeptide (TPR) repeat protein
MEGLTLDKFTKFYLIFLLVVVFISYVNAQDQYTQNIMHQNIFLQSQEQQRIAEQQRMQDSFIWNINGVDLYNQGKYNESIQAFDKAIELSPYFVDPWINKGNALYNQGKYKEAIQAYNSTIEIDPQCEKALLHKSLALEKLNRNNSTDAKYWYRKGNFFYSQSKYEEAIQAYSNAIVADPNNTSLLSSAWNLKGLAFRKLLNVNESIKCFDEAIRINPNNTDAWYNKGLALKKLNRNVEADVAFAKAS